VIVTGPKASFAPWREVIDRTYLPTTMGVFLDSAEGLPAVLAKPVEARVNAYVCEGVTCLAPIRSESELREKLELPTIAAFRPPNPHGSPP